MPAGEGPTGRSPPPPAERDARTILRSSTRAASTLDIAGPGRAAIDAFGPTEASGELIDLGSLAGEESETLCRAELRAEGPLGEWTARFASAIFDEPRGVYWDVPGLLAWPTASRSMPSEHAAASWHGTGEAARRSLRSSRRRGSTTSWHRAEIETVALDASGAAVWRVAHSDVVAEAEIVGGSLVLTSFGGQHQVLDPQTGIGRNA